jgi:hypothetical protein
MAQEAEATGLIEKLFTPEAVMIITFAVIIDAGEFFADLIGLIPVIGIVGQVSSVLLDIIALIFIGLWMYTRSKKITVPVKTAARIKKVVKFAKKFKWLRPACMIIEMIPVVSSLAPLWIVAVLLELASD